MTPLSPRYALGMLILSGVALIPVTVNTYVGYRSDDCAHPDVLLGRPESLHGWRQRVVERVFEAFAWREGSVAGGPGEADLHYSILRSYDPKKLYYRPDYGMIENVRPVGRELEWLEADREWLPVHVPTYPQRGARRHVGAYLLVYAGELVARPILNQLLSSPRQMFVGNQPMTLYFVWAQAPRGAHPATEERLREWLVEAWRRHQLICSS